MDLSDCLSPVKKELLKEDSLDFAATNGIVTKAVKYNSGTEPEQVYSPLSFTLFPTPIPRSSFQFMMGLQEHVNVLLHRASQDQDFMINALQQLTETDDFIRRLLEIYKSVKTSAENLEIGLFRTDYMFDFDPNKRTKVIKQIESNTFGPNYVAMGTKKMAELYRYVLRKAGMDEYLTKLPNDNAAEGLAKIFARAWEMYGNREAVLLVVYDESDRYGFDQRLLEYEVLGQNPLIRTVRKTLKEMTACAKLDRERKLFV